MNEWNIQSRARACQACEKPFADKEPCHTLLLEEHHQYLRMDVCKKCWETQYSEGAGDRKGFISQWLGVYQSPPPAPPEPIQRETAEDLLRKLIAEGRPQDGPVCYILAVMLERRRVLKVKEQFQRDGARVFLYEQPRTGDIFTITDPNLQLNQLEEVQRDISLLLNPPPPPAPAPPVLAAGEDAAAPVAQEGGAPDSPQAAP
jgi:hypothetical protein